MRERDSLRQVQEKGAQESSSKKQEKLQPRHSIKRRGASSNIICHDVVVGVLLKHLNVIERIAALKKILNEPCAQVRPVTKNLSLNGATGTRLRFGNECFPRQFRVRRQRIIEHHACRNREQAHADQWQQNTRKT